MPNYMKSLIIESVILLAHVPYPSKASDMDQSDSNEKNNDKAFLKRR